MTRYRITMEVEDEEDNYEGDLAPILDLAIDNAYRMLDGTLTLDEDSVCVEEVEEVEEVPTFTDTRGNVWTPTETAPFGVCMDSPSYPYLMGLAFGPWPWAAATSYRFEGEEATRFRAYFATQLPDKAAEYYGSAEEALREGTDTEAGK